ncbi:MAG: ABC transporter [Candidatus Marinimicrobia bacterium]|jgi:putative ABC transport system permease protein|nr:ABC transporter [Candidatus Neomarinimicrobiota bacterium]MEC7621521.1 ABC transporter permease [Candidatus Neomarinimicrobiota bacterium]MEC7902161.1 ABC transporter permease [Candidatus Neomarinimicrobiota bacterium]MED5248449.1 ABC transporter permease [Candidatus Neomarinimicrobiota bacterium]|tara:strand:- start:52 stop:1302 length:1251 start_codon:yes stop_codon:yes gene_type:complete
MLGKRQIKSILRESVRMTFDAIRQNKLRSTLTLLGISVGIFSVISVMTAIKTLESSIESGLNVFGTNTFLITKDPAIQFGRNEKYRNRKNIDLDQYLKLKERAKLPILVSGGDDTDNVRLVTYKDKKTKQTPRIAGGDPGTLRTVNTYIADGRNLTDEDVHLSRSVCIIGADVVDALFPFEDPLGKVIQLQGINFTVVGITERQGQSFGQSQDNYVFLPITTFLQRFRGTSYSLGITVESESAEVYSETVDEVIGILRTIRKVSPGEENDFEITTNEELMETFGSFTGSIKIFAFSVSVIALIVAGIGIMNIMLVSVTERIKEIGIRKAIGATKGHILIQFLTEAVFLCQVGGIIGVVFGIAAGNLISFVAKVPAVIPIDWAIYGVVSCSLIGIGFGSYPAWRAANLDPVESMRFE